MIASEGVIASRFPGRHERLAVEDGRWTLRWEPAPHLRAGLSGRVLRGIAPADPASGAACVNQVHGSHVVTVDEPGPAGPADALVTTRTGLVVAVRVADCLPVLLAAPHGVAAIHAGWRGAAADIVGNALARLLDRTGDAPGDVRAWVGPGIGTCCFEVGPEVVGAFDAAARRTGPRRDHVDLPGAVARGLVALGLPETAIDVSPYCTRCHQHLWYSHRGSGGKPGRLTAWIERLDQERSSVAR